MDKNFVVLEGNVTRDVELASGGKYCFVSLAVGKSRGNGADFVSVKAFGEMAISCAESLRKGDRVAIEGRIATSNFTPEGKKDKVYRTDIVADMIKKLPKGSGSGGGASGFVDDSFSLKPVESYEGVAT